MSNIVHIDFDAVRAAMKEVESSEAALKAATAKLAEKRAEIAVFEADVSKAEETYENAKLRAQELLVGHTQTVAAPKNAIKSLAKPALSGMTSSNMSMLKDETLSIRQRIAQYLLENPLPDWKRLGEVLYGDDVNASVTRSRINAHITSLRKEGVVRYLGTNKFEVGATKIGGSARAQKEPRLLPAKSSQSVITEAWQKALEGSL